MSHIIVFNPKEITAKAMGKISVHTSAPRENPCIVYQAPCSQRLR